MPDWGDLQVDQLRHMARTLGDTVAYRDLGAGTAITFSEWDARSNQVARGLARSGVEPGDRVSIYLPSERALDWIVAYAAVHKAGAVVVPTNTRQTVPELTTILGHAEIVAMLTCEALLPTALEVQPALATWRTIITAGGAPDPGTSPGDTVRAWDDVLDGHAGALERLLDREPSKVEGAEVHQRPSSGRPDRRAGCGHNDGVAHGVVLPSLKRSRHETARFGAIVP